jgi:glucose-6-phosphate-specific signal transduction histidine kinase
MGEWAEDFVAEFDSIDHAVDWIKNHREELLVGTVIVIAGVAFAVAVAASAGGALILVPLVLVVEDSSGPPPVTGLARSSP